MMKIHKYTLEPPTEGHTTTIEMPKGAKVFAVRRVHGTPRIFAFVDPEAPAEERSFAIVPTGADVEDPDNLVYWATLVVGINGQSAHIFERPTA